MVKIFFSSSTSVDLNFLDKSPLLIECDWDQKCQPADDVSEFVLVLEESLLLGLGDPEGVVGLIGAAHGARALHSLTLRARLPSACSAPLPKQSAADRSVWRNRAATPAPRGSRTPARTDPPDVHAPTLRCNRIAATPDPARWHTTGHSHVHLHF